MKNFIFSRFSLLCLMAGMLVITSCGDDDDPIIVPGGGGDTGINVADGLYLAVEGSDPVSSAALVAEVVEANDFKSQERSGFVAGFMYLESGKYNVVSIADKAVSATIGGSGTVTTDAGSDCDHNDFILITTEAGGAAFDVAESGLYKVTHDQTTSELILYNIQDASIIGSATPGGWGADTPMTGTVTSDGASFSVSDVILRDGEWKIRFNCRWGINRRIDQGGSLDDPANGYQLFTNFGGALAGLEPGGANIAQEGDGIYKLDLNWTARDGWFVSALRTGDAPVITFNPNNFQMAVIGDATAGSWDTDRNLFHSEANGVHSWYGVVTFGDTGEYKFRANDAWDIALGGDLGALDGGGGNIPTPGAGGWYIVLSTPDEGATWSAMVTSLGWSVIGEGSPSGNWDTDTAMTANGFDAGISTYTMTGDFTTGGWKFRAGRDWAHSVGGDLTFLTTDGDNIALANAGTYTVTLSYNGEVYSATVN